MRLETEIRDCQEKTRAGRDMPRTFVFEHLVSVLMFCRQALARSPGCTGAVAAQNKKAPALLPGQRKRAYALLT